jgi:hypothetical protein
VGDGNFNGLAPARTPERYPQRRKGEIHRYLRGTSARTNDARCHVGHWVYVEPKHVDERVAPLPAPRSLGTKKEELLYLMVWC